jgi:predicted nucleic acid-binding protein
MDVLVDTSIWSMVLRRRRTSTNGAAEPERLEFAALVEEDRVRMIGIIRQEILSGVRHAAQFERLRTTLRSFPDEPAIMQDHERAAEHFNTCRSHGIQGSHPDMLICAVAERLGAAIFTSDQDFTRYVQHLPISLHAVRPGLT